MIKVSRLGGREFYINPDLVSFIEVTPDTVLTMTNGQKVVVAEGVQDILDRIIAYRIKTFTALPKVISTEEKE